MPTPVRQTRTALPSVAPHCVLSFSAGLSFPLTMIGGRLWRAKATSRPTFGPPVHVLIRTLPFRYPTSVARPSLSGSYVSPLIAEPLLPSMWVKPALKVERSRQRCPYGTDIGPRIGAFGGSYRPG